MSETLEQLSERIKSMSGREFDTPEKVDLLNRLAEKTALNDSAHALELATEAHRLAERLEYTEGIANSLGCLGFAHYLRSDYELALPKLYESLGFLEVQGDIGNKARIMNLLGGVHLSLGNFEQALANAFEALKLFRETGNKKDEGWCLHGIGTGLYELGDHARAVEYYKQCLKLFEELGFDSGRARAMTGLGTVYENLGDYEKALEYQNESLKIFQNLGIRIGESRALNDLGQIYQHMGELDKARQLHLQSLKIREELGTRQAQSTSLINLGLLHIEQKDIAEALGVLKRALEIAEDIKARQRIYQAHKALAEAYELDGNHHEALGHFRLFHKVKEDVFSDETQARIKDLQVSHEVEQAEKESEIHRLKNIELKEKNEQLEQLLAKLRVTQSQLVQSEKMAALGSLVAGLVHEMNTPLGAINSSLDVESRCLDIIDSELEKRELSELAEKNITFQKAFKTLGENFRNTRQGSDRITKIVDGLRSFVRLDEAEFQLADLHDGLKNTITLVQHKLKSQARIIRDFGDIPPVPCFPGEINQLFMHLLTNAAQSLKESGEIALRTSTQDSFVRVEISDNGIGMTQKQVEQLSDPTFSAKGSRVKAGLGLLTCYNIMAKHNGKIEIISQPGQGTTVTLLLPLNEKEDSGEEN